MTRFVPVDRNTLYLFPPSVQEWLPENHLARFVVETVDQLDLDELERAYAGRGSAAFHPGMLLGLLIFGYATGVFSSRKIERASYDSVAFRFVAANTHPDHDTINEFRKRFLKQLKPCLCRCCSLPGRWGCSSWATCHWMAARCTPMLRAIVRCPGGMCLQRLGVAR